MVNKPNRTVFVLIFCFLIFDQAWAGDSGIPFLKNEGQADEEVAFYTHTLKGTVFVTKSGSIVYSLPAGDRGGWVLNEKFGPLHPRGGRRSPVTVSSFKGNDPSGWRSGLYACERVELGEAYPGIRLELRIRRHCMEKLFLLNPGADCEKIRVLVEGAKSLAVDAQGRLAVETGLGRVLFTRPKAYQEVCGKKRLVDARYTIHGKEYGFALGDYDRKRSLVIDPLLASTFLGGSGNEGGFRGMTVLLDANGNVYGAGQTTSMDFPTTAGAYSPNKAGNYDIFIVKMDSSLKHLLAATYLGGSSIDGGKRGAPHLAFDGQGNLCIAGQTYSVNFPITAGAYDSNHNGGRDLFIAKMDSTLSNLLASTYLGAGKDEDCGAIKVWVDGSIYLSGHTRSSGFPTTSGAFDTTYNGTGTSGFGGDIFVSKLTGDLTALVASTFVGGSEWDYDGSMDLNQNGDVFVSGTTASPDFPTTPGAFCETYTPGSGYGSDIFLSKLDNDLTNLLASTYLGGTEDDWGYTMILEGNSEPCLTGHTSSSDFPVTPGAYDTSYNGIGGSDVGDDAYVAKMSSDLDTVLAATFLGGDLWDMGEDLAVDAKGTIYLIGQARSNDFPTTSGAFCETYTGGSWSWGGEVFISRLNSSLALLEASTFFGGTQQDAAGSIALDQEGNIYAAGYTNSSDFPVSPGAFDTSYNGGSINKDGGDAFIAKMDGMLSASLYSDVQTVPESTGGTVNFSLAAGKENSGRSYLLLGCVSGTAPGTPLPGGLATLPLNWDTFTNIMITQLNSPIFTDFLGTLDPAGTGGAQLNLPPVPGYAGAMIHFAFTLNGPFDFVSNPRDVEIVP